jgi:tetratricopeptide (TPR) repeat protein
MPARKHTNHGKDRVEKKNGRTPADIDNIVKTAENAGLFIARGHIYAEKGDYGRAIPEFSKALELEPETRFFLKTGDVCSLKRNCTMKPLRILTAAWNWRRMPKRFTTGGFCFFSAGTMKRPWRIFPKPWPLNQKIPSDSASRCRPGYDVAQISKRVIQYRHGEE